jgi:Nif-specific regulatory protein
MAGNGPDDEGELAGMRAELDLYRGVASLGIEDNLEPFIEKALGLVVELAGARCGYLELRASDDEPAMPRFSLGRGGSADDGERLRESLSTTVIDEVVATGKPIATVSASEDPRFSDRGSVRRNKIDAVLCVPIGDPPMGVIYLQGRECPGPFSEDDQQRVQTFARLLATYADRLLLRAAEVPHPDPTAPYRRVLHCADVVGTSPALAAVLKELAVAAPHDITVLLGGPMGTGKTQLARVLHQSGPRATGPFVEISCGALVDNLFENELFGAMPGAHSTASAPIQGKVQAAERGTLFLDEIAELSMLSQSKLLQFIQSREYRPLGSAGMCIADVRIIAATHVDLKAAIAQGKFRGDLFSRLSHFLVRVPPLSERRGDIPALAKHFCALACTRNRIPAIGLSPRSLDMLEAREWEGNIRDLAQCVEVGVLRADSDEAGQVEPAHLFPHDRGPGGPEGPGPTGGASGAGTLSYHAAMAQARQRILRETLAETNGNVAEAARRLDLARSHVNNLIKRYGK